MEVQIQSKLNAVEDVDQIRSKKQRHRKVGPTNPPWMQNGTKYLPIYNECKRYQGPTNLQWMQNGMRKARKVPSTKTEMLLQTCRKGKGHRKANFCC